MRLGTCCWEPSPTCCMHVDLRMHEALECQAMGRTWSRQACSDATAAAAGTAPACACSLKPIASVVSTCGRRHMDFVEPPANTKAWL